MNTAELRRSMLAGIAFVVLFVAGLLISFANDPSVKSSDSDAVAAAKYVHQLSSSGHRTGLIVGAYLLVLAAVSFVWFGLGLRARLASAAAGKLVASLAILGGTSIIAAGVASADVAGAISFGSEPVPNGDTIRVMMDLTYPFLFVGFGLASAAVITVVAISARRSGLPAWVAYTAWLGVLGSILSIIFFPVVLALLWYLAVAITGLTAPKVVAASSTPTEVRATR